MSATDDALVERLAEAMYEDHRADTSEVFNLAPWSDQYDTVRDTWRERVRAVLPIVQAAKDEAVAEALAEVDAAISEDARQPHSVQGRVVLLGVQQIIAAARRRLGVSGTGAGGGQ